MSEANIKPINVAEELSKSFLEYSMSVIISRALPDVRDGLKPSQRRILYAMRQLGVGPGKAHVKCAKIVGETMGNFHPHGDMSIYTIARQHGPAMVDARNARSTARVTSAPWKATPRRPCVIPKPASTRSAWR